MPLIICYSNAFLVSSLIFITMRYLKTAYFASLAFILTSHRAAREPAYTAASAIESLAAALPSLVLARRLPAHDARTPAFRNSLTAPSRATAYECAPMPFQAL